MTEQEFWKKLAKYLESEDENYVRCVGERVLEMLSARLTYDEAEDLKSQLPMGLKMIWERREKEMNKWDSNEIISHVQQECKLTDRFEAENAVLSVFAALQEGISAGEASDVESQLPKHVKFLWEAAKQKREVKQAAGRRMMT